MRDLSICVVLCAFITCFKFQTDVNKRNMMFPLFEEKLYRPRLDLELVYAYVCTFKRKFSTDLTTFFLFIVSGDLIYEINEMYQIMVYYLIFSCKVKCYLSSRRKSKKSYFPFAHWCSTRIKGAYIENTGRK